MTLDFGKRDWMFEANGARDYIERWHSRMCRDSQEDLRNRFRSKDDRHFKGALFELYVHETLLRAGFEVECHPRRGDSSRRPDFSAQRGGDHFFVEAKTVTVSDRGAGRSMRERQVWEALDKVDSPNFMFKVGCERVGQRAVRGRFLTIRVREWLGGLTAQEHEPWEVASPALRWTDAGWSLRIEAVRRPPNAKENGINVLSFTQCASAESSVRAIREGIAKKTGVYGELESPFVLALGTWGVTDRQIAAALYGDEVLDVPFTDVGAGSPLLLRDGNGSFGGGEPWLRTELSAVLVARNPEPYGIDTLRPTLWDHPAPRERLTVQLPRVWGRVTAQSGALTLVEPTVAPAEYFG